MYYTKPPLNFHDQTKMLMSRGLIAKASDLENFLKRVNYYRFTGYLYPYRKRGCDEFQPNTTFETIYSIYNFDKKLRLLTFSAIETIDVAILRTLMVEKFALQYGPFGYTDWENFINFSINQHENLLREIDVNVNRSKEEFVVGYREKYNHEEYLPFWMISELSSFGQLSRIFQHIPLNVSVPIAKQFNLHTTVLISWLRSLTTIRNICAHHARLWNRTLPVKPLIPSKKHHPEFYQPVRLPNHSYIIVLAMLKYLLDRILPTNRLINDYQSICDEHPEVPLEKIGFPENWTEFKVFQSKT